MSQEKNARTHADTNTQQNTPYDMHMPNAPDNLKLNTEKHQNRDEFGRFVKRRSSQSHSVESPISSFPSSTSSIITDSTYVQVATPFLTKPEIFIVPPAPSSTPVPSPTPKRKQPMSRVGLELFKGDGNTNENSQNFIRLFRRDTADQDNQGRCELFKDYLCQGSPADDWYEELKPNVQEDWNLLRAEFDKRWPKVKPVKKSAQEYEDELMSTKLETSALGTKVTVGGMEVWSHVAWANGILRIAVNAGVQESSTYIGLVRKGLPDLIKEKVGTSFDNWTLFTDEVRNVNIEYIKDGVERANKRQTEQDDLLRRLARLEIGPGRTSQSTTITAPAIPAPRYATTTTTQPAQVQARNVPQTTAATYTAQPARSNPQYRYRTTPPMQSTAPRQPLTLAEKDLLYSMLNTLPHHPDTPAGNAAWLAQIIQWDSTHGGQNGRVTHQTPFPLKPGTAMICSGECFRCGTHGHNGSQCPIPPGEGLSRRETAWRAICSINLGGLNRAVAPGIHLVELEWKGEGEDAGFDQGKG